MLKYWIRVLLMEESRLVKRIYNHSRKEYLFRHRNNWVKKVHNLVQKYDLMDLQSLQSKGRSSGIAAFLRKYKTWRRKNGELRLTKNQNSEHIKHLRHR